MPNKSELVPGWVRQAQREGDEQERGGMALFVYALATIVAVSIAAIIYFWPSAH